MAGARIILVDSDPHTAGLLVAELAQRGYGAVDVASGPVLIAPLLSGHATDAVIVNHRYGEEAALEACNIAKRTRPDCVTIVAASAKRVGAPG